MSNEIRIVIADDHPIVRQGLRQTIEAERRLKIVAEAGDGKAALEKIAELGPEVAILDVDMPEMGGFEVARALRQQGLSVEIIFLTIHDEEEVFQAAMDLGAKGYVLKDSALAEIITAINSVAKGRAYISPALSAHLLKRSRGAATLAAQKPGLADVTPTERRILKLIAQDKTSKEIAAELFVSPKTVEAHRWNICQKLELHGNLALIKFALEHKSQL